MVEGTDIPIKFLLKYLCQQLVKPISKQSINSDGGVGGVYKKREFPVNYLF